MRFYLILVAGSQLLLVRSSCANVAADLNNSLVDGYALGVGIGPRKNEARQSSAAHALHYLRTHPNALPSRRAGSSASSAVTH